MQEGWLHAPLDLELELIARPFARAPELATALSPR
jgi:hypothetical protein